MEDHRFDARRDADGSSAPGGLDRRSLLRKAAVAGAVAWTAPMVVSSPAGAQATLCTPKCASTGGTFVGLIGGSRSSVVINVSASNVSCPCGSFAGICVQAGTFIGPTTSTTAVGNKQVTVTFSPSAGDRDLHRPHDGAHLLPGPER